MNAIGQMFSKARDNAACDPAKCINGKCRATGECACPPWPVTDREYANLALVTSPPLAARDACSSWNENPQLGDALCLPRPSATAKLSR